MEGEASVKVPEGKLVTAKTRYNDVIEEVKIRGDFFIQPAKALNKIEAEIEGLDSDTEKKDLRKAVERVDAELIGFSAEDVAEAVKKSMRDSE